MSTGQVDFMRLVRSPAWFALLGLAAAALCLAGCATSRQSRYLGHLNGAMAPGKGKNRELALAFGLDEFRDDGTTLVNAGAIDATAVDVRGTPQIATADNGAAIDASAPR
jgi:hypothetical protein